jgi:hypothetical protein
MSGRRLARLARMGSAEVDWRARAFARMAFDRFRMAVSPSRWDRDDLVSAMTPLPELEAARRSLRAQRWDDAHRELTRHFSTSPRRFVIAASDRLSLPDFIRRRCPGEDRETAARADRILNGDYDLLGYRGLRFGASSGDAAGPSAALPDWHYDPVHGRHAPMRFWSAVPFLDPQYGDHKIIWELNRHQHWLTLGRAWWLTGDSRYRERCVDELYGWLEANPPLHGINWASMLELGLRSLSWLWMLHLSVEPGACDDRPWTIDVLLGIDRQLAHVERNLSYYFSPNTHLSGEALALYVAGQALPELQASARRVEIGRRVLLDEIDRQIAADGGHREGSTHYHRYTLDFYLLALVVARITHDPAATAFERAVHRLASAARVLADDRGHLPRIGDDDGGTLWPALGRPPDDIRDSLAIAGALLYHPKAGAGPTPQEAVWMLAAPELAPLLAGSADPIAAAPTSAALRDVGYYVSRSAAGDHLVIDGGPHGYRNGGHAHADALSLTMTLDGEPLLLDPGTGCYTADRTLRNRMRSTALHNTVVLDGRPQSIPDGPFHWARAASSRTICWQSDAACDYFVGVHDGYSPQQHRRHVLMMHGDFLLVADFIAGIGSHDAAVHWHIGPAWSLRVSGPGLELASPRRRCDLILPSGTVEFFTGDQETGLGWNAPVYGRLEPATSIRVTARAALPFWLVTVFGFDMQNRVRSAGVRMADEGAAIRILRDDSTDDVLISESQLMCYRTRPSQQPRTVMAQLQGNRLCAA